MTVAEPRSLEQRTTDTRPRLERDEDAWIATAAVDGVPYLIPLSFLWDGTCLFLATPTASPTSRNMQQTGKVRLGLGTTRDVVTIEASVQPLHPDELTPEFGDAFAAKTGFDPRQLSTPYTYFRVTPVRMQAWREANELVGRDVMKAGRWLAD